MAIRLLRWVMLLTVLAVAAPLTAADKPGEGNGPAAVEARLRKDVTYLASDQLEGRGVTTPGINLAADYIAAEFQKAGLKPAGKDGSYFQPFTMRKGAARRGTPIALTLHGPQGQEVELQAGKQFEAVGLSGAGKLSAPVVFAGFGATARKIGYDDFRGMDVANKVVIVLRKTPRADNRFTPFDGDRNDEHAALATKLTNAEIHGAAAVLFVNDHTLAANGDALMDFAYTAQSGEGGTLPALHVRRSVVDAMLQPSLDTTLRDLEKDIDRDLRPHSARLSGWTATLDVQVERPTVTVKNVVGVLEGAGPLANETVVIGAHYDHLGYGGRGSGSMERDPNLRAIHHGADDNASGTAAVLELARRFGRQADRQGRRLVFIAFSGEESGLLGSIYYCKHPIFPLADTVAMVNLDMVGRLRPDPKTEKDRLLVEGSGTAKTFNALLDDLAGKYGFALHKQESGYGPSDQESFYKKEVPVIFYWTGYHADYHRPSDTADKINYPGMRKVVDLTEETVTRLATAAERPVYVELAPPPAPPHGDVPRLGVRFDYGADTKDGVLLDGVTPGLPAAKAGIKGGDVIVAIDGKPVRSIQGYMALLQGRKKGDAFEVEIVRGGKKATVKVTLE
jgi:hypothetical protein